ncbi:phosphoglyceromutase [Crocosphaera chwakensis CCY0110]|uniref:Phosphoglyceromutase n=1 Tax=Crocosphaera chwakensis CCY0110 TaxID=391612 RepID=A3IW22_9CHRO|nr:phosphoglyceromutase [Crocosphaera chwakensis CCY0110]
MIELQTAYNTVGIYLTGNLVIDFPEEDKIKIESEEYT